MRSRRRSIELPPVVEQSRGVFTEEMNARLRALVARMRED
jgi:hypothetical protein